LKFDADAQLLEGKNASGVFKVLDEVLLTGFKLSELSLNWLGLHGGKNIEKVRGTEGFVVRPMIHNNNIRDILLAVFSICKTSYIFLQ